MWKNNEFIFKNLELTKIKLSFSILHTRFCSSKETKFDFKRMIEVCNRQYNYYCTVISNVLHLNKHFYFFEITAVNSCVHIFLRILAGMNNICIIIFLANLMLITTDWWVIKFHVRLPVDLYFSSFYSRWHFKNFPVVVRLFRATR